MKILVLSVLLMFYVNGCILSGPGPGTSCIDHCSECKEGDCIERLDCLCACDPACKSNPNSTDTDTNTESDDNSEIE